MAYKVHGPVHEAHEEFLPVNILIFGPSDDVIDKSLDARSYLDRLAQRAELDRRDYDAAQGDGAVPDDCDAVAVLGGLSALQRESGYMEVGLDTVFGPQELLEGLRPRLPEQMPLVAVVDDAYSDYITASCLKAGASAVVGTSGALFGVVSSRIARWEQLVPFINVYRSV